MANVINSKVIRIIGGNPGADQGVQGPASPTNQLVPETIAIGTDRRRFRGPSANGHFSIQVFADTPGGAGSAMTVWYSNLPDPGVADDTAWTQDLTIGTIDITTAPSKFQNLGNVDAEWIMVKTVVATSPYSGRVFARVEGVTHGKVG